MLKRNQTMDGDFHKVLDIYGPALLRLAGSYTNTRSDKEDLFQDIALAIWRSMPHFRGESSERTFVFRIAHNRAITYAARHRPPGPSKEADSEVDLPDPRSNLEWSLAREQQEARLFEAIHRLPVDYRQVVTLTLEGMSYSEIAEILGIGESNVGARLTRARQMLRDLLGVHS